MVFSFFSLADGFNRSESCVAILLQNSLDAKRSYGTIMNVKMEQYGDLRGVFTNYSSEHYKQIIMKAYEEAGIDPANVAYIEADGCAIKVFKMYYLLSLMIYSLKMHINNSI